jgi:hypothetical protein
LQTISASFEEVANHVIKNACDCVLNPSSNGFSIDLSKVVEMIQMILILTKKDNFSPLIMKLMDEMMAYILAIPPKGLQIISFL